MSDDVVDDGGLTLHDALPVLLAGPLLGEHQVLWGEGQVVGLQGLAGLATLRGTGSSKSAS